MRDCWSTIQGKTALTAEDVRRAKKLGERLIRVVGIREQAPVVQAAAARIRQQALTLLLASYDETRRAIAYLRWHQKDANTIAPSLYAGRIHQPEEQREVDEAARSTGPLDPTPSAHPIATPPRTPMPGNTNGTPPGLAAVAAGHSRASPFVDSGNSFVPQLR